MLFFHLSLHIYFPSVFPREYATDVNVLVAKQAIQAIGQISLQLSTRANTCVDKLLSLLTMDIDYVTSETLVAMTSELPPLHVLIACGDLVQEQLCTGCDLDFCFTSGLCRYIAQV